MNITDNTLTRTTVTVRDVAPGQVFSFDGNPAILLMTGGNKYVRLLDGSIYYIANCHKNSRVKIYEHELVLKAVE